MRQYFFLGILTVGVLGGIIYVCWLIVASLYHDWILGRHVGEIQAESEMRRERRAEEARRRLDNGCEHVFGETLGGFPPNACHRCGLEMERPPGNCDHVWRMRHEAVPCSYCEKCGKRFVSPVINH